MSRQSSPTAIGAFVVGAVILIAGAFAIFGGSQIFATKIRYVALFDEPTNGLRVGADVLLNGVRIGYVSDIDLIIDRRDFGTDTQVTLEILPENFMVIRDDVPVPATSVELLDHDTLVNEAGLRATLEIESFVTSQLRVNLLFQPDSPAVMRAIDAPYPEIPTITSNIQVLLNKVQEWFTDVRENVDLTTLSARLNSVLTVLDDALGGIDELVRSKDLRESLAGANRLINDEHTQQLAATIRATLNDIRSASASAAVLFENADEGVDVLIADLQPILENLNATLSEAEQTLAIAQAQLRGDSEQFYRLGSTIDELERAARSVREFFDYIERNPEALLRGKTQ